MILENFIGISRKIVSRMKFEISQFTFDPKNEVNISDFLFDKLTMLVSRKILRKKQFEKYKNWTLVYWVSSDENFSKKLKVSAKPLKSKKYKVIDYYTYFPKLSKYAKYSYNKRKFIIYFFQSLEIILNDFDFHDSELISGCMDDSLAKLLKDPRANYINDRIYL